MVSDTQAAYFAGLFDGEGSCGIYSVGKRQSEFRISITNCDPRPLQAVLTLFGGRVRRREAQPNRASKRPIYEWYRHGQSSEEFLICIRPYTIIKSEQIDVYLTARTFLVGKGNKKAMRNDVGLLQAEHTLKALKRC